MPALLALLLLLPSLVQAQGTRGFLLKLHDPQGLLAAPPIVSVAGSDQQSRDFTLKDDGVIPDAAAADGCYSGPVFGFPEGALTFEVRQGDLYWIGQAEIDPADTEPLVSLLLEANGQLTAKEEIRPDSPGERLVIADSRGEVIANTYYHGLRGVWLWFVLLAAMGGGAGQAWVRLGRRPEAPSPLSDIPRPDIPPLRLHPDHLEAALNSALGAYRLVVLGPLPRPAGQSHFCLDEAPLPREIVRAVEDIATRQGPPVALLICTPERLDPQGPGDPLDQLAKEVGGRFPLWVVNGPTAWQTWLPAPPPAGQGGIGS